MCVPLACTCPILVPDGPVLFCFCFKRVCVALARASVLHVPLTEIGGQGTVSTGVVHDGRWRQGGVTLGLCSGGHQAGRGGRLITGAARWGRVGARWRGFMNLHVFSKGAGMCVGLVAHLAEVWLV